MKLKWQYLCLEVKKTLRMFPRMLLQAILLMVLIGTIAFCGVKSADKEPLAVSVEVAVASQEDNRLTRMALSYVENMESVSKLCSFRQTTEEEGFALLEKGDVAALIVLPDQLVEGIMNGVNPSVDIWFCRHAGLEAMLFRELTESGAGLLRVAQAQIYGAGDVARAYGLTEQLSGIETQIDSYNLAFALDRLALFDSETVSVFGALNGMQFYLASGIVLFLMLAGMALYPVVQREPSAFCRQLGRQGAGQGWQCFCQWVCGFLCMAALACLLFGTVGLALRYALPRTAAAQLTAGSAGGATVGVGLGNGALIVAAVSTFVYLFLSLAGSRASGILLVFVFTVGLMYLSGGLVPAVFLPEAVQTVGEWLPTACLIQAAGGILTRQSVWQMGQCPVLLCSYMLLAGAGAVLIRCRQYRG